MDINDALFFFSFVFLNSQELLYIYIDHKLKEVHAEILQLHFDSIGTIQPYSLHSRNRRISLFEIMPIQFLNYSLSD